MMRLEKTRSQTLRFEEIRGSAAQAELERLLNSAFGVPAGGSFYDDFPVWEERHGATMFRIGAYSEVQGASALIATASVRIAEMRAPLGTYKVALIGCVATHEAWRGQGLASQIVPLATEWAREQGAALAILWGSEHSLYQRLDFELCGTQARLPLEAMGFKGPLTMPVSEVRKGWNPGIFKAFQARKGGLALSAQDEAWLSAHKNVDWYWTGAAEAPTSYVAIGRGIDLAGFIHEWGGEREVLLSLLQRLDHMIPGLEMLGSPALFQDLGYDVRESAHEFLCMARVLEPRVIWEKCRIESYPEKAFTGMSDRELTRRFYGPGHDPLPLWIWGLDGA